MRETDGVLRVLLRLWEHANTRTAVGSHHLVFGLLRMLKSLFDYVCCRSITFVSGTEDETVIRYTYR
jgi:hypothetical protein